jgi:hypothetical protein
MSLVSRCRPVTRKIRHKGLKKLYEEDSAAKVLIRAQVGKPLSC